MKKIDPVGLLIIHPTTHGTFFRPFEVDFPVVKTVSARRLLQRLAQPYGGSHASAPGERLKSAFFFLQGFETRTSIRTKSSKMMFHDFPSTDKYQDLTSGVDFLVNTNPMLSNPIFAVLWDCLPGS